VKSKRRSGYQRFLQELVQEYMQVHKVDQVDLQDVAEWAVKNHKWRDRPYDPVKRCKHDMARALAVQYTTDPQGREVRAMIAVPMVNADNGQNLWEWAPIYSAPPNHFAVSQQVSRGGILSDCREHKLRTDSYNDNNVHGGFVEPFDYDFNSDLAEQDLPTDYPDADPAGS